MAQAAAVCLDRHHVSPCAFVVAIDARDPHTYGVSWPPVTALQRSANANVIDATEEGAYAIAIAAADRHLGLVAVGRAAVRKGADYLLLPAGRTPQRSGQLDFEDVTRLEVRGMNTARSEADIRWHLSAKVTQLRKARL